MGGREAGRAAAQREYDRLIRAGGGEAATGLSNPFANELGDSPLGDPNDRPANVPFVEPPPGTPANMLYNDGGLIPVGERIRRGIQSGIDFAGDVIDSLPGTMSPEEAERTGTYTGRPGDRRRPRGVPSTR